MRPLAGCQNPPHGRPTDSQPPCDLGVTEPFGLEPVDLGGFQRRRSWATMRPTLATRLGDPGAHPLPKQLSLELGKDGW